MRSASQNTRDDIVHAGVWGILQDDQVDKVTHWMPLPEPPEGTSTWREGSEAQVKFLRDFVEAVAEKELRSFAMIHKMESSLGLWGDGPQEHTLQLLYARIAKQVLEKSKCRPQNASE